MICGYYISKIRRGCITLIRAHTGPCLGGICPYKRYSPFTFSLTCNDCTSFLRRATKTHGCALPTTAATLPEVFRSSLCRNEQHHCRHPNRTTFRLHPHVRWAETVARQSFGTFLPSACAVSECDPVVAASAGDNAASMAPNTDVKRGM